jgi:hypothetical protein
MNQASTIQAEVTKRIRECLKELDFEAEVRLTEHEGVVHARKMIQDRCVRVVAHVSDREPKTAAAGSVGFELAKARAVQVAIRPTLAARTAARLPAEEDVDKKPC